MLACLSLLAPHAPGYDPWAWLIWGRELAQGGLDTAEGPAFKPLPVLVDAGLWRLLGDAGAPAGWLLVARTGALVAVGLGARVAYLLAGRSAPAAVLAAAGLLLLQGFAFHGAVGSAEGLALAFGLGVVGLGLGGRHRAALAVGLGLAALRPESWLLLAAYAGWRVRHDRALAPWAVAGAVGTLAVWIGPEWLASGDPLRSGTRATIPNPGAPATAELPAWAALRVGLGLPAVGLLVAAALAPGRARLLAALGLVWIVEVALMAQLLGTSGELRYSLPGAGLLVVAGAVGGARVLGVALGRPSRRARDGGRRRQAVAAAALVLGLASLALRADDLAVELDDAAQDAELARTLPAALAAAGGVERLRACRPPEVGRYRGPMVAWALGVPRREVRTPTGPGRLVLRSSIRRGASLQPPSPPGGRVLGSSGRWRVEGRCGEPSRP